MASNIPILTFFDGAQVLVHQCGAVELGCFRQAVLERVLLFQLFLGDEEPVVVQDHWEVWSVPTDHGRQSAPPSLVRFPGSASIGETPGACMRRPLSGHER